MCGSVPCGLGVELVYLQNNLYHFKTNKETNNTKLIRKQVIVLTTMTGVHKLRIIYDLLSECIWRFKLAERISPKTEKYLR